MGKRDRERIQRILSGDEQSIAEQSRGLSGVGRKAVGVVERMTKKIVEKTMAPAWMKMSLPQQCKVAGKMLKTTGMVNFRSNFLKDSGFPSDLVDQIKVGKTPDEVRAYYWDCPEWVAFWENLGLNRDHFEELLSKAL